MSKPIRPQLRNRQPKNVDAPCPPAGITTPGVLVRVIDGDTVEVEIRRTLRVRMLDCWAPESRTKDPVEKQLGLAAKAHLLDICPIGSPVTLFIPSSEGGHIDTVFSMGRVLGAVWATDGDPRDLSQRQRDAGHATATQEESPYSGDAKRKRKKEAPHVGTGN